MAMLLIVEDDPIQLEFYSDVLSDHYHVLTACSVADAIHELATKQIQAVGCDYHLQGGSGLEVVKWIATHTPDLLKNTVLISGESEPNTGGFDVQCLQKPVAIDTLLETFIAWLPVEPAQQQELG